MAEAAQLMGLGRNQTRLRLKRLDTAVGGGVLRRISRTGHYGKFEVNPAALRTAVHRDEQEVRHELGHVRAIAIENGARLEELKREQKSMARRICAIESAQRLARLGSSRLIPK